MKERILILGCILHPAMSLRLLVAALVLAAASRLVAEPQLRPDRLVRARTEPQNWLTYSGTYDGWRHSALTDITPGNAKNLELKWTLQAQVAGPWEASPLVADGVMYVTQRPNDV